MPSTTVHLPDALLAKIDSIVKEKSISRNRFIIQACEEALKKSAGQWPQDFFEPELSPANLKLLKEGVADEKLVSFRESGEIGGHYCHFICPAVLMNLENSPN
jgi:hypothetical protein